MDSARVTRRRGPLSALYGEEASLAIGDATARHVRLTVAGIGLWLDSVPRDFVAWTDVRGLAVAPPITRWPHPAIGDSIGPVLDGLIGGGGSIVEPVETPTFPVRVLLGDSEVEWSVTQHHLSGYRRGDAQAAVRLIEYIDARPDARVLLSQPSELLDRVAAILRARPPIAGESPGG